MRAILRNEPVIIRNPGAVRPWQHVLEPLTGYMILCERLFTDGPQHSSSWNFGPEVNDSKNVEWIINRICELIPEASYRISSLPQPHEATYLKLDISKAKTHLKWIPKWNLEKALLSIAEFTNIFRDKQDVNRICLKQIIEFLN
jgi:CDP-glucose 4,6-dehydratase